MKPMITKTWTVPYFLASLTVCIWPAIGAAQEMYCEFNHVYPVVNAQFLPHGRAVVARDIYGFFLFFDIHKRKKTKIQGLDPEAFIAFTSDGKWIATGNPIRLWNTSKRKFSAAKFRGDFESFSDNNKLLTTVSHGTKEFEIILHVYDMATKKEVFRLTANRLKKSVFSETVISPDSKSIAIGKRSGLICIYDIRTGKKLKSYRGHKLPVVSLAYSPDGSTLVSAGLIGIGRELKIWDLKKGVLKKSFPSDRNLIGNRIIMSPDGRMFATNPVFAGSRVVLYELRTRQIRANFPAHNRKLNSIAFSPNGRYLVTGAGTIDPFNNYGGSVRVWDLYAKKSEKPVPKREN